MTHTLHPEIQDAVDKLVSEITKLKPGYYNADCLLDLERMILKCVGKYLSLPKSNPQIEKMKIQKLGGEVTLTRDMTIEKINEIIDYIHNNLPTKL